MIKSSIIVTPIELELLSTADTNALPTLLYTANNKATPATMDLFLICANIAEITINTTGNISTII